MLRQKYVAGTHCHPICSDNYIILHKINSNGQIKQILVFINY